MALIPRNSRVRPLNPRFVAHATRKTPSGSGLSHLPFGSGLLASQEPAQVVFQRHTQGLVAQRSAGMLVTTEDFTSSFLIAPVRRRRQVGTSWYKGANPGSAPSRPRRCAAAVLQ
jgi:hypothetical protein